MTNTQYSELLKDLRWQEKRLKSDEGIQAVNDPRVEGRCPMWAIWLADILPTPDTKED